MKPVAKLSFAFLALAATAFADPTTAPAPPLSPEAQGLLSTLEARKTTLKDFTAKIDYSVEHIDGDRDGKIGTVDYLSTPDGPSFSADFTLDTVNGKPTHKHKNQIIADPKNLTVIDFDAHQYDQSPAPAGNALNSPLPLPIGIPVKDITDNFTVSLLPSKDPNLPTLRFKPLLKGHFDFDQLDLTVDKKLELPTQIVAYKASGEITTIKILAPAINTGKAKILSSAAPGAAPDWTINIHTAAAPPKSGP